MKDKNKELQELVDGTLTTAKGYVEKAIPLIEQLGEDFRSVPSKESWNELIHLFDGFAWIIETVQEIDSLQDLESVVHKPTLWQKYVQAVVDLNRVIPELKMALENKDHPLIADLLLHAVVPSFKGMLTKLSELQGY